MLAAGIFLKAKIDIQSLQQLLYFIASVLCLCFPSQMLNTFIYVDYIDKKVIIPYDLNPDIFKFCYLATEVLAAIVYKDYIMR